MKTLYTLIFLLIVLISCNSKNEASFNRKNIRGIWLIHSFNLDDDYDIPNNNFMIMDFKDDSLLFKSLDDKVVAKRTLKFSKDSISVDTIRFPIRKFTVEDDKLTFRRVRAHRILAFDVKLNKKDIKSRLVTNYWKNEKGIYHFIEKDNEMTFVPYQQKRYESYCYEIIRYENSIFLQKKGNQLDCDRDYQFIEQIVSISDDEMITYGFVDGDYKKIVYHKTKPIAAFKHSSKFQLCNPYLNKKNPRDRYYYHGTEYKGGLYHIRKIVDSLYIAPKDSNESGIFQVRFVVNCQGKAGMFESQAFDNDYQLKKFPSEISDQIFEIAKGLQEWNPGRVQRNNVPIDTYIYLSFRIKNGKIIRIYP